MLIATFCLSGGDESSNLKKFVRHPGSARSPSLESDELSSVAASQFRLSLTQNTNRAPAKEYHWRTVLIYFPTAAGSSGSDFLKSTATRLFAACRFFHAPMVINSGLAFFA